MHVEAVYPFLNDGLRYAQIRADFVDWQMLQVHFHSLQFQCNIICDLFNLAARGARRKCNFLQFFVRQCRWWALTVRWSHLTAHSNCWLVRFFAADDADITRLAIALRNVFWAIVTVSANAQLLFNASRHPLHTFCGISRSSVMIMRQHCSTLAGIDWTASNSGTSKSIVLNEAHKRQISAISLAHLRRTTNRKPN